MVASLELLRDTFCLCHLLYQPKKHFLCLPVNIRQIIVQPVGQQQCGISTVLMLTEIPAVALSPNANQFAVRHGQAGEPILLALLVPQAVFRIKCVFFIIVTSFRFCFGWCVLLLLPAPPMRQAGVFRAVFSKASRFFAKR